MLTTGNQLKAARALAGLEQKELADRSGVAVTTVRKMEWKAGQTLSSGLDTIRRVQIALEAAGIEFLNHGQPGVRLHARIAAANLLDQQKTASGSPVDPKLLAEHHRQEHKKEQG